MLLLGACASVSPDKVAPNYVSAKQFVFAGCDEMAEEMAQAKFALSKAKGTEQIAEAKGRYEAIERAGYSKHCGDARYADHGPTSAPAPAPQVIVVQSPPQAQQVVERPVYVPQPYAVYVPQPYAQPQPYVVPVYRNPVQYPTTYYQPHRDQYQYREGLAAYPHY